MKRKQTQPREANTTIFVVGEGASEINYFNTLYTREGLGQAGISIRTNDLPVTATDYKALFRLAEQKAEVYDSVYCVIDMDAIHDKKVFRKYLDAKEGLKKKRPTIHVIESFPCFEVWILLHYTQSCGSATRCADVEKNLRKFPELANYRHGQPIYDTIRPKQKDAVRNAGEIWKKRDSDIRSGVPETDAKTAYTEIYQAVEGIFNKRRTEAEFQRKSS